ncbi:hypothetical protein Cyrtocomes_01065 [Candidatus Cyrtobacter comes]|uniref:Autotransporter domain-containing protein n=2 Tax=Candidatus Cyrtobacter comes TaxID=675776 RepID=A0ABU5L975_9RICK|nr:hypothetical protein [Candidatus Cyrtobacter comes]
MELVTKVNDLIIEHDFIPLPMASAQQIHNLPNFAQQYGPNILGGRDGDMAAGFGFNGRHFYASAQKDLDIVRGSKVSFDVNAGTSLHDGYKFVSAGVGVVNNDNDLSFSARLQKDNFRDGLDMGASVEKNIYESENGKVKVHVAASCYTNTKSGEVKGDVSIGLSAEF